MARHHFVGWTTDSNRATPLASHPPKCVVCRREGSHKKNDY